MNVYKLVLEYINKCPENEPILVEDIKKHVIQSCKKEDTENILKNVNVILNRMKKDRIIKSEYKGVYYKPVHTVFGEMELDINKLRKIKYLEDKEGNIKGYITGAKLFNLVGLTTLVPNVTDVVTNRCKYHKQYDEKLRTYILKPKIKITNENYKYLQFIDILENKDDIHIEAKNENDILYNIIKEFKLDFEKIIKYIRDTNSKKALDKILELAR